MESLNELAENLSHDELVEVTQSSLAAVLLSDSLLSDLPSDVILEEVLSQIAIEHGQSITVYISRETEPRLKVIIPHQTTVRGLKKAIARHFDIHLQRTGSRVKLSWKYIWRTYNLNFEGILLDDDNANIEDYGVCNKTVLEFKKKRKIK